MRVHHASHMEPAADLLTDKPEVKAVAWCAAAGVLAAPAAVAAVVADAAQTLAVPALDVPLQWCWQS